MDPVYHDILDDGKYDTNTPWAALILKDNLKASDNRVQYVATTRAPTQAIAIANITKKTWSDHYWIEGTSTTRILAIFRVDNKRIFAENADVPVKRRRRR